MKGRNILICNSMPLATMKCPKSYPSIIVIALELKVGQKFPEHVPVKFCDK